MATTVLLADPHVMFREAVRSLLERAGGYEIAGEAGDGQAALEAIAEHQPDLVILETRLPRLTGSEVTRRTRKNGHPTRFLFLSAQDGVRVVEEAFESGASGYVCKQDLASELISAVESVRSGRSYVSPSVAGHLVQIAVGPAGESDRPDLTSREREILQLVAEGMSSKEIGESLHVSVRTVDSHRANLMRKLDVHNVSGLVRYAIREGLVAP